MRAPQRPWSDDLIERYYAAGYWDASTLAEHVVAHAEQRPHALAFVADDGRLTWSEYEARSARLAAVLTTLVERREPVAVMMSDGAGVHVAYLAAERAGNVAVAIGARAGVKEIEHLLAVTGARTIVTGLEHARRPAEEVVDEVEARGGTSLRHVLVRHTTDRLAVTVDGTISPLLSTSSSRIGIAGRALGPDDLFFVNSTSGTTGLPKCVMHTQNRWKFFHSRATHFRPDDVFLVVVPAPFGFGLWTAHFSPTLLGATAVTPATFDAARTCALIEHEGATVLAAVTSQVVMMLASPALRAHDLSTLRVAQTGGERVPYDKAAQFEDSTGAMILQFYGSNEAGCVSGTHPDDPRELRLRTAGRPLDEMHVRVFAENGTDITASGGPGQCGCRGPAITPGYLGGPDANEQLFRSDGWLLLGDIVTIDEHGYLAVVGRTADFIIRGGRNISAPELEEEIGGHPRVAIAAVVGVTDDELGERVCAFAVTKDKLPLALAELLEHLEREGVAKETWPEALVVVTALPQGIGGKIAKAELRAHAESLSRAGELHLRERRPVGDPA